MELNEINQLPRARVTFSKPEVDLLLYRSTLHYDHKCRQLSVQGGMLYGMANKVRVCGTAECDLWFRELDLLSKVCEIRGELEDFEMRRLGLELRSSLHLVMSSLNQKMITAKQQQELDAFIAEKEQLDDESRSIYSKGYNAGSSTAAEAIRQGNWSWEDYQAWKSKQQSKEKVNR